MKNKAGYHHGDLRNALITFGVDLLAEDGIQGLSLRKLARRAGVSHNAPYMHFADKEALLAAIAEEGFRLLTEAFETAVQSASSDWRAQLHAGCGAYVQFALEHPNHLQVMLRPFNAGTCPSLSKTSLGALDSLQRLVAQGQEMGHVKAGDSREIAVVIWSLLHGLSTIWAGHKMPATVIDQRRPEEMTHIFVQHLYAGLRGEG